MWVYRYSSLVLANADTPDVLTNGTLITQTVENATVDNANLVIGADQFYRILSEDIYGNRSELSDVLMITYTGVRNNDVEPKAIFPSKLFPRDYTNLIIDTEMVDADAWQVIAGGGILTPIPNSVFGASRFMMKTSGSTDIKVGSTIDSPVEAGKEYYYGIWAGPTETPASGAVSVTMSIKIEWYSTDIYGEPTVLVDSWSPTIVGFKNKTQEYIYSAGAPIGAQVVRIIVGANYSGGAFDFYVASPTIRRKMASIDISTSGVDNINIAAEAVDDAKLSVLPYRYIAGLDIANNVSFPTTRINVTVGACAATVNNQKMVLFTALTKRLDAGWAVGSNNGGLDTGTAVDGTYHVHLIKRMDTGVVDALLSLSPDAPTMPSSYTRSRRIASIIRSGGVILPFSQSGNEFLIKTPNLDVDVITSTTAAVTRTLPSIPTGIKVNALMRVAGYNAASWMLLLSSLDTADIAPDYTSLAYDLNGAAASNTSRNLNVRTNLNGQIRTRGSVTSNTLRIAPYGWIDTRGQ